MFGVFYDMSSMSLHGNQKVGGPTAQHDSTTTVATSEEERDKVCVASCERDNKMAYILLTTVSGKALEQYCHMSDEQIVSSCLATLRRMFGSESVGPVLGHLVTRWGSQPHAGMSYSYVAVGASGADYDVMAETELNGRLHFAGEVCSLSLSLPLSLSPSLTLPFSLSLLPPSLSPPLPSFPLSIPSSFPPILSLSLLSQATNRQHPQTVTGAYLSGIREACKIMDDLI